MSKVYYVRGNNICAIEAQKKIIEEYFHNNGICMEAGYIDYRAFSKRKSLNKEAAKKLGFDLSFFGNIYPELEHLLSEICMGRISEIIVDVKLRLFPNVQYKKVVLHLCEKYKVRIVEVGDFKSPASNILKTVTIYHAFSLCEGRTGPLLNAIDDMYQYAMTNYPNAQIQLRFSPSDQSYDSFKWAHVEKPDILLVKHFFHIRRKTESCLSKIKELQESGVDVISINEGKLQFHKMDSYILSASHKIIGFQRLRNKSSCEELKMSNDRFRLFIGHKAPGWSMEKVIVEESEYGFKWEDFSIDADMIMVNSFSSLQMEISNFVAIMSKRKVSIFSLQKGEVCYIG